MNAANRRPETRASKPAAADPRKSWNCPKCESSNRHNDETCHICGNSGSSSECSVRKERGGSNRWKPPIQAASKRAAASASQLRPPNNAVTKKSEHDLIIVGASTAEAVGKKRLASCSWSCFSCSFENSWLGTSCQICHAPRPSVRTRTMEKKQTTAVPPEGIPEKRRRALPKQNLQHQQPIQEKKRWAYLKTLSPRRAPSQSTGAKSCESSRTTDKLSERCTRSSGNRNRLGGAINKERNEAEVEAETRAETKTIEYTAGFSIEASSTPPLNWGNPLPAPTLAQSSAISRMCHHGREQHKATNLAVQSEQQREQLIQRQHRDKEDLQALHKHNIFVVSLQNGEEFAGLESDAAGISTATNGTKRNTSKQLLTEENAEETDKVVEQESESGAESTSSSLRPEWVLALEVAYNSAKAAQESPSGDELLPNIQIRVQRRLGECTSISQLYSQLRMAVFGAQRTDPFPEITTAASPLPSPGTNQQAKLRTSTPPLSCDGIEHQSSAAVVVESDNHQQRQNAHPPSYPAMPAAYFPQPLGPQMQFRSCSTPASYWSPFIQQSNPPGWTHHQVFPNATLNTTHPSSYEPWYPYHGRSPIYRGSF